MHARHYAPALGRFLQPDPAGLEDSLYAYAANNPVTEMDPDGTCFIVCQVIVGAIIDTVVYVATTQNASIGGALGAVAAGAVESAVNPLAKITKVTRLAAAATRMLTKAPKANRAASAATQSISRAVRRVSSPRNNTVYIERGTSGPRYVGITNNYARRASEHRRAGRNVTPSVTGLNRFDAHAVEQAVINRYGLSRNGGTLTNAINSVSRRDLMYRVYVWRGNSILKRAGVS